MDVNLRLRLTDEEAAALNHVLEKTPDGVFATAEVESISIASMPMELSSVNGCKLRVGVKFLVEVESWFDEPVDVTDPVDVAAPMVRPVLPVF